MQHHVNHVEIDLARSHAMILTLTSPPPLSDLRLWTGLGVSVPSASHPMTQGLQVPESFPSPPLSVPIYTNNPTWVIIVSHLLINPVHLPPRAHGKHLVARRVSIC